jgi:hypothetical protein
MGNTLQSTQNMACFVENIIHNPTFSESIFFRPFDNQLMLAKAN